MIASVDVVHWKVSFRTVWSFLLVRDDDGRVGVGECSDGGTVAEVDAAVAACRTWAVGAVFGDDLDEVDVQISERRGALSRGSSIHCQNTVVGALEMALADLSAQRSGRPLWELLGGTRAVPVPLYANINRALRHRTPEEFAEVARQAVASGFRAVKCAPFDHLTAPSDDTAGGLRCVRAVREVVGPEVAVMVDVHHRLTFPAVLAMLEVLEDLDLAWIEDAVLIDDLDRLEELAARTRIPLAGGELSWEVDELVRAVDHGLRIVLPDVKHAGGLRRAQRMAGAVAPAMVTFHNPTGPVGTLASGHLSLACPNTTILEYAFGEVPWRNDTIVPPERVDKGKLILPSAPGAGAQLSSQPLTATPPC